MAKRNRSGKSGKASGQLSTLQADKKIVDKEMKKIGLNYHTLFGVILIILGAALVVLNLAGVLLAFVGLILIYFGLKVMGYTLPIKL